MGAAYKFGWIPDDERRYEYQDVYAIEKTSRLERLVVAPSANQVSLMLELIRVMPEPYGILYVLVVSRSEAEAGRYRAADFKPRNETEGFLSRFKDFFENDGRHHIWIASPPSPDTLVYDRHNVIYAYGRLPEFERIVSNRGLSRVEDVKFQSLHTHNYNAAFDTDEQELLQYWPWVRSPLRDNDC
jgi:hypothetical protein